MRQGNIKTSKWKAKHSIKYLDILLGNAVPAPIWILKKKKLENYTYYPDSFLFRVIFPLSKCVLYLFVYL